MKQIYLHVLLLYPLPQNQMLCSAEGGKISVCCWPSKETLPEKGCSLQQSLSRPWLEDLDNSSNFGTKKEISHNNKASKC